MKSFALGLLCAGAALGQSFGQLATNRDGSVLYFVSPARLKGTTQYFHPKIFRWDAREGVRLYEQREADIPWPPEDLIFFGRNYYTLRSPFVSSDGLVVAFSGIRHCRAVGVSICGNASLLYQATVRVDGKPELTTAGAASLSPNGRFLLLSAIYDERQVWPVPVDVRDLQTGDTVRYSTGPPPFRTSAPHRVANDGSVLLATREALVIARGAQSRAIPDREISIDALLNDSASRVVFERRGVLALYSATSNAIVDLAPGLASGFPVAISDDASRIAAVLGSERQPFVVGADGTGLRQVARISGGVAEIAMSGDGSVIFAVTLDNRLARIDVASGAVMELVPPTSGPAVGEGEVSRGAITRIAGARLASQSLGASSPYPLSLGGVEVRLDGAAVPLVSVSEDSIRYVVPWDLPARRFEVEIRSAATERSPFVAGLVQSPQLPAPYLWITYGHPFMHTAAHGDFRGLVTPDDPARPGQIIHVYARDLGRVEPEPPPGVPNPLAPLSRLVEPISCQLRESGVPVEVLFAGLAPGFAVNVFQVDVRVPPAPLKSPDYLSCGAWVGGYLYFAN